MTDAEMRVSAAERVMGWTAKVMNLNQYTRGKTITSWLFFAGGFPKFKLIPNLVRWGRYLSIFWLGTELVIKLPNKSS